MYQMQEAVDLWSGLIHGTGGALFPSKTFWYVIDFKWQKEEWAYAKMYEIPGSLEMSDTVGTIYQIC